MVFYEVAIYDAIKKLKSQKVTLQGNKLSKYVEVRFSMMNRRVLYCINPAVLLGLHYR